MAALSKLSNLQKNCLYVSGFSLSIYVLIWKYVARSLKRAQGKTGKTCNTTNKTKRHFKAIDLHECSKILRLCQIVLPSMYCKESATLMFVIFALSARTWADLWMIGNNTSIESAIIGKDLRTFHTQLSNFICAIPMISMLNSSLRLSIGYLKMSFFDRLSSRIRTLMLQERRLYQFVANMDCGLDLNQLMLADTQQFCNSLVDLITNMTKPSLTIFICLIKLSSDIGISIPMSMMLYLVLSGAFLTRLRQPAFKLSKIEKVSTDQLSSSINRVISNSEQVAFYGGEKREASVLAALTNTMMKQRWLKMLFKFGTDVADNTFAKYFATVVGFLLASTPLLQKQNVYGQSDFEVSHNQRLTQYFANGRLLIKMATSVGCLIMASRDVTTLVTATNRIDELHDYLVRLEKENNNRGSNGFGYESGDRIEIRDKLISFENVPVVTPDGQVLIESLNIKVPHGTNVLVTGPNGCGKSSMFRILGQLWPLQGGKLTKPPNQRIFYIPQIPYMTSGNLREQIIYPDSEHDARVVKSISDDDLLAILEKVDLVYLLDRAGWDSSCDWTKELSGGEKQRLAMARLLYHKPHFAILDECTSAVSVDIEAALYSYCKQENITLFTVSHRKTLYKFHDFRLLIRPNRSYSFTPICSADIVLD